MQIRILATFFLFCALACRNNRHETKMVQFDAAHWATKKGADYPFRAAMLDDLIQKRKLHGLKLPAVIALLGEPVRTENGYLYYPIAQKRFGSWPISTKTLVIKLGRDSTVEWRKIHG